MINTSLKHHNLHISAVIIVVISLFFDTVSAQTEKGSDRSIFRGAYSATIGGTQQQWVLTDKKGNEFGTVLQRSAPVTVSVPLANRLLMTVANSGVISEYDTASSTNIVDTRITLSYVFPGEKLWLTGSGSLPTGKTKLNQAELNMTNLLGQTAFAYKAPTFGQGYTGNISMVYAGSLTRRMVLGLGLSYFYKGPFSPLEGSTVEYDAGDEISLNTGFDYITFSKTARFSVDITATYFLKDQLSNTSGAFEAVFEAGPRVIANVIYSLRTESMNHTLLLRTRYRLQNNFISSGKRYDASSQVEGQYSLGTMLLNGVYASFVGEGKYYTPDQTPSGLTYIETGDAVIGSAGADFTLTTWGWLMPTAGFRYAAGSATIAGTEFDVNGIDASLSLRFSF